MVELGASFLEWEFDKVEYWEDWDQREHHFPDSSTQDTGIDCVGTRLDGSLVAIQCKARGASKQLTKRDVDSFGSLSAEGPWIERWVVTDAKPSQHLENLNKHRPTTPIRLVDYLQPVRDLVAYLKAPIRIDPELTKMQDSAVDAIVSLLPKHCDTRGDEWNPGESRGHIVLPCGTGKTRISYRAMKALVEPGELTVVLVPSIALVSQIKKDYLQLAAYDGIRIHTLAVCSDRSAGRSVSEDNVNLSRDTTVDQGFVGQNEIIGETALNKEQVISWLQRHANSPGRLAIFSTYQSAHNLAAGLIETQTKAKLMIGDEAHRTAGIRKINEKNSKKLLERLRNFTLCHDKDKFPAIYRLYQTATPRVYTRQQVDEYDETKWEVKSMNDASTFGPELYRLSYRDAVARNLLSDYRIVAWCVGEHEVEIAEKIAKEFNEEAISNDTKPSWNTAKALRALGLGILLSGGMGKTENPVSIRSVISFSNRVKSSMELERAINSPTVRKWLAEYLKKDEPKLEPAEFEIKHLDAKNRTSERNKHLMKLAHGTAAKPYAITNVGIFGEGTDSPDLSAVAFLDPRKSPVDVIQAVGRVMRKSPSKDKGLIFIPLVIPPGHDPETFLTLTSPSDGWVELGQILNALRSHDDRIEESLADLIEIQYPSDPSKVAQDEVIVYAEPFKKAKVTIMKTKNRIEHVVAQQDDDDLRTIEQRLDAHRDRVSESLTINKSNAKNLASLLAIPAPSQIHVVRLTKDHEIRYDSITPEYTENYEVDVLNPKKKVAWHPAETIQKAVEKINKDKRSQNMPPARPSRKKPIEDSLGKHIVTLGGERLKETDIHLRILEKSGIQAGPKRDLNIIRNTVNASAGMLRRENLEAFFSEKLGMESQRREGKNNADACTVATVILVNSAIMQARLEKSNLRTIQGLPKLNEIKSSPHPVADYMKVWNGILKADYKPIFEQSRDLLQELDIEYRGYVGVDDAMRRIAKDALDMAENYAQMGMDHAGELFNKVMGNQRSDGAFFTRPISATMLAELVLHTLGPIDWRDQKTWESVRTFDPSCGSGTLLVGMLEAVKHRILNSFEDRQKGAREAAVFHRKAVEDLFVGADINAVALQLAGSQLTIGNSDASYNKINLHLMEYGEKGGIDPQSVRVGSAELLLDHDLFPKSNLEFQAEQDFSTRLAMSDIERDSNTDLLRELVEHPPKTVLMNPPYTSWTDIASKYSADLKRAMRERLGMIWDEGAEKPDSLLTIKKSSLATIFEEIAYRLVSRSNGVMAMVRPLIFLLNASCRDERKIMARSLHIDYVLVCHDPMNFNLSWDTTINECLLVASAHTTNQKEPTRFIQLDTYPETVQTARKIVNRALRGENFGGSWLDWDYKHMLDGDWYPASFRDVSLAEALDQAMLGNEKLCRGWGGGGTGRSDGSISRSHAYIKVNLAGGDWRKTGMKKYTHYKHAVPNSEPVISGTGMESQLTLKGSVNKWVKLTKLPNESDSSYKRRLELESEKIGSFRSHLLVSKGFNAASARLTAIASEEPRIGYSWMPVTGNPGISFDKAKGLCIWFNSTLGRCLLRTSCGRTVSYPMYNPDSWHNLPYPDIDNPDVIKPLVDCYEETREEEVPPFREGQVRVRELWDDAVSNALAIERSLISSISDMLQIDPYVSKDNFYESL